MALASVSSPTDMVTNRSTVSSPAVASGGLQPLVYVVELPRAELGVGRAHQHGTVAGLAGEPQHGGLRDSEIDGDLALGGSQANLVAVEIAWLAAEQLTELVDPGAQRAQPGRRASRAQHC